MVKEPVGYMPCPKQEYEMRDEARPEQGLGAAHAALGGNQAEPGVGFYSVSTRNSRSCM